MARAALFMAASARESPRRPVLPPRMVPRFGSQLAGEVGVGPPGAACRGERLAGLAENWKPASLSCLMRASSLGLAAPGWLMPERSPFTSAAKTGTPMRLKASAITCRVTVLPVPVAPVIRPWRLAMAGRSARSSVVPVALAMMRGSAMPARPPEEKWESRVETRLAASPDGASPVSTGFLNSDFRGRFGEQATGLALLRDDFDGGDGGVVLGGNELEQQRAVRVGFEAGDFFHQGVVLSGLVKDVQVAQDRAVIAENAEHALAGGGAGIAGGLAVVGGVKTVLDEVQGDRVLARSYWNRIGEVAPALAGIELGIVGTGSGFLRGAELAAFEVHVRTPPLTVIGVVGHVAGDDANGTRAAIEAGQNFNGGDHAASAFHRRKIEMQLAISGGMDVGEDFDIGGAAAIGIRENVEVSEQRLAVGGNGHDTAAFAAAARVFGTVEGFGEVQAEFISAGLERNAVGKVTLAAGAVDRGILSSPNVLDGAADGGAAGEEGVRSPLLAGAVDVAAIGSGQDADFFADREADGRFGGVGGLRSLSGDDRRGRATPREKCQDGKHEHQNDRNGDQPKLGKARFAIRGD